MNKKTAEKFLNILAKEYPKATIALKYKNVLELLVATVLSAQCTDKRVNIVTASLFKKYKKVEDYANATNACFEDDIRSTGFYKNKAKNIIGAAKMIISRYSGKVPDTMEKLITLPGVARKTANIVLYHGYGRSEGIAVDTHVQRLSGRMGLSAEDNPVKIEQDLMALYEKESWGNINVLLVEHGRKICGARKPLCSECVVQKLCPSAKLFLK